MSTSTRIPRSASRKRSPAKRGKKRPRAPKPKPKPKRSTKARSEAAKRGWIKRRQKQQLIDKMVELRMQPRGQDAQPLGWTERRQNLRLIDDRIWRQISFDFDQKIVDRKRLEILKELEIDMLGRTELHDYLGWIGEEANIEISDVYRMYLGYPVGEQSPD